MMNFTKIKGIASPLELSNVDTDMIIPKQFLKTIKRDGLGKGLFYEMRFFENGKKNKEFILNKKPFCESKILVSNSNFGCGSSREHAPWAILDFGIRVIIAESFADIFYNNCFKNGILPIKLEKSEVQKIINEIKLQNFIFTVDLKKQTIINVNLKINFEIDIYKKDCLINGWDDIDLTLKQKKLISEFEDKNLKDWIFPGKQNA